MSIYVKTIAIFVLFTSVTFSQIKIAYINSQQIISNYSKAIRVQKKLENYSKMTQEEYQKKQQELYQPIIDEINQHITQVSKNAQFEIVFDTVNGSIVFAGMNSVDLTKDVLKSLEKGKLDPALSQSASPDKENDATEDIDNPFENFTMTLQEEKHTYQQV